MNGEERAGLGGCVEVLEGTNGREQTNSSLAWLSIPPGWPQCLRSYISPISRLLPWGAAGSLLPMWHMVKSKGRPELFTLLCMISSRSSPPLLTQHWALPINLWALPTPDF